MRRVVYRRNHCCGVRPHVIRPVSHCTLASGHSAHAQYSITREDYVGADGCRCRTVCCLLLTLSIPNRLFFRLHLCPSVSFYRSLLTLWSSDVQLMAPAVGRFPWQLSRCLCSWCWGAAIIDSRRLAPWAVCSPHSPPSDGGHALVSGGGAWRPSALLGKGSTWIGRYLGQWITASHSEGSKDNHKCDNNLWRRAWTCIGVFNEEDGHF